MDLNEHLRGFGSDSPTGSGRARGSPQLYWYQRFRRFYKVTLKLFVNDFEIVYDMDCICI